MLFIKTSLLKNCRKLITKNFSNNLLASFCNKKPENQVLEEAIKITQSEIKVMKQMIEGKYDLQTVLSLQTTHPQFAEFAQYLSNNSADVFNTKQQKLSFQLMKCQTLNQIVQLSTRSEYKLIQQTDPNTIYLVLFRYLTIFFQESSSQKFVKPQINKHIKDLHNRLLELSQNLDQQTLISIIQFDNNHYEKYQLLPLSPPLIHNYSTKSVGLVTQLLQKYPKYRQGILNHYKLGKLQELIQNQSLLNIVKLVKALPDDSHIQQLFTNKIASVCEQLKKQNSLQNQQQEIIQQVYKSLLIIIHVNQKYLNYSEVIINLVVHKMSKWQILQLLYNTLIIKSAKDSQIISFVEAEIKCKPSLSIDISTSDQQDGIEHRHTSQQFLLKLSNSIAIIYKQYPTIYKKYSENFREQLLQTINQIDINLYQNTQIFELLVNFATIFPSTLNNKTSKQFIKTLTLARLSDHQGDNLAICIIIADRQGFLESVIKQYIQIFGNLKILQSYSGPFFKPLKDILNKINSV